MRIIFFISIFFISVYATTDEEIEAIQNATVEDRFKLMNSFKKKLIKMKEKERLSAMKSLLDASGNKHLDKALEKMKENAKRKKIREDMQEQQINEESIIDTIEINDNEDHDDD